MFNNMRLMVLISFAIGLSMFSGCTNDGQNEFQGTASWNGTPIEDGYVEFQPTDGMGQIAGIEIVGGKFTVRTQPGEKKVSVIARKKIGETKPTERIPIAEPIYHFYIPEQFNSLTELSVTLNPTDPTIKLDLTGKDVASGLTAEQKKRKAEQGGKL